MPGKTSAWQLQHAVPALSNPQAHHHRGHHRGQAIPWFIFPLQPTIAHPTQNISQLIFRIANISMLYCIGTMNDVLQVRLGQRRAAAWQKFLERTGLNQADVIRETGSTR
jgi:hypothetical protein